jgi:hypothetical protein
VLIAGRNDSDGAFYNSNGNLIDSKSTEIYDPVAATWSLGPTMAVGRRAHAASLINSTISTSATAVNDVVSKFQILITGGAGNIAGDKAEVLTRETKITTTAVGSTPAVTTTTWTVGTAITMPAARSYHTSTLLDSGDVLLVGGKSIALADLDTIDLFDVDNTTTAGGAFTLSAQKKLNYARSMHRSVRLTSSAVLIVGNYFTNAGTADKRAELWSPP